MAIAGALLFGLAALRRHGSSLLWGAGGAIFGLILAAVFLGVANAAAVPYAAPQLSRLRWEAIALVLIVLAVVALVTRELATR